MKQKAQPTEDKIVCRNYIQLLAKYLKQEKDFSSRPNLSLEDKKVIAHHLKDIARHVIVENPSTEDYVALFMSRINRLINGDSGEWGRVLELVRQQRDLLTQIDLVTMDDLFRYFTKKRASSKK